MENVMANNFAFSNDDPIYAPWAATTTGLLGLDFMPVPDADAENKWDDFMRWRPSQVQSTKPLKPPTPPVEVKPDINPPVPARQSPVLQNASLGFSYSVDSQSPPAGSPPGMPFKFGQASTGASAFSFASLAPDSAPNSKEVLPFPNVTAWASNIPHDADVDKRVSPVPTSTPSLQHSPNSNVRTASSSASGPSSPEPAPLANGKKRKSSPSDDANNEFPQKQPVKKSAHNMIEKRYRNNLNDKIAALRDCVPSLRVMSRSNGGADEEDEAEDLEGLTPAHKLNKATILSKATEYIRHLEKRNKQLQEEVATLKQRMEAYDKIVMAGGPFSFPSMAPSPEAARFPAAPYDRSPNSRSPPQGLIPVPPDIASLRSAAMSQPQYSGTQQPYGIYASPPQQRPATTGTPMVNARHAGGIGTKIMVGALTGLMIMEGFREKEPSDDEPEGRGLFALPVSVLGRLAGSDHLSAHSNSLYSLFRICVLLAAVGYLLLPLLDFKPQPKKKPVPATRLSPAPSLASPVEVRRKAWLTAIQTVWVPQHSFILEVAALTLKTLKLSTRKLIGWQGYSFLTGTTQEQEAARIKAWEIALDAQLTGGDEEISTSRLLLTLLASGTLPNTPARMMVKALHSRLMLWDMSKSGRRQFWFWLFDGLNKKMARNYWAAAREQNRLIANGHIGDSPATEPLPDHLAALLEQHPKDVLVDTIVQRAYNLAWNKPTSQNADSDATMDGVVEDFAISSPLDALASWFSGFVLCRVLFRALDSNADMKAIELDLALALRTAPPGSQSHLQALVAKAVLTTHKRGEAIAKAYAALPSNSSSPFTLFTPATGGLTNTIPEIPIPNDIQAALTMAKCIALISTASSATPQIAEESRKRAISAINGSYPGDNFTLLSFVAAYKCLEMFSSTTTNATDCDYNAWPLALAKPGLERLATALRVWVGGPKGARTGLPRPVRALVVSRCITVSRELVGVRPSDDESDAGYVSADEREDQQDLAPTPRTMLPGRGS